MQAKGMFYAYVHAKPDASIFYVGKGSGDRAFDIGKESYRRSAYHTNVVEKYGRGNILVGIMECSSESVAFDLERGLIKCLRRSGARLVNHTDGGEGVAGYKWSKEAIERMAASKRGRKQSESEIAKRSEALRRTYANPEVRAKLKLRPKRKHTEATRLKMSIAVSASWARPDVREKHSLAVKGSVHSEESKRKIAMSRLGKRLYNNGQKSVLCFPGTEPDGYVLGRLSK